MKKLLLSLWLTALVWTAALVWSNVSASNTQQDVSTKKEKKVMWKNKMRPMKNGSWSINNKMHLMMKDWEKWPMMKDEQKDLFHNSNILLTIQNKDYSTFKIEFQKIIDAMKVPTEEEFNKMVTKMKELKDNKIVNDKMKDITYEEFIKNSPNKQITESEFNLMKQKHEEMNKKHEEMKIIVLNWDYTKFKEYLNNNKPSIPTEEEFNKIVSMYETFKWNKTEIKNVKEELKGLKNEKKDNKKEFKKTTRWIINKNLMPNKK